MDTTEITEIPEKETEEIESPLGGIDSVDFHLDPYDNDEDRENRIPWRRLDLLMPVDAFNVVEQAINKVKKQLKGKHKEARALELICGDFLAGYNED